MNRSHILRFALLILLIACGASVAGAHAQPRAQAGRFAIYVPVARAVGGPAPAPGELPAKLVGTWFYGQLLPRELYDPTTGPWGSANGLGQLYTFAANGDYTYLAFFRIETPGCTSEVSVFRSGTASAAGASLALRPATAKTRTVTYCGGRKESVTNGPYDEQTLSWGIGYSKFGVTELTLADGSGTMIYHKQGMAPQLAGAWHKGAISSAGFYDPATQAFAANPGEGWWISMAPSGSYRWGEFGYGRDQQGCMMAIWLYLSGTAEVAGSHLTFTPSTGVVRVENECAPGEPVQQPWSEDAKGFTWALRDFPASPRLVLIPDGRFQEYEFLPE